MICTIFFLSRILSIILPYSTFDLGPCLESRPHVRMSAIKVDDKPISWERTDGGPNAVLARGCTAFSKRRSNFSRDDFGKTAQCSIDSKFEDDFKLRGLQFANSGTSC